MIAHIGTYLLTGSFDEVTYANTSGFTKILYAFIPNVNLIWGIKVLTFQEGNGDGAQWNNLFDKKEPSDPITFGVVWIMFIVDIIFYSMVTWYLDSIKPGEYGVAQPWYFVFQPSYWVPSLNYKNIGVAPEDRGSILLKILFFKNYFDFSNTLKNSKKSYKVYCNWQV